jgi:hypothetical protein
LSNEKNKQPVFFSYDSLTIYDGGSSTSSMMGKYCGNSIPPSHVSSSNEVLIQFKSDGSQTRAGFKMEYIPTGKQNTSIQNNTKYHRDSYRILGLPQFK